VRDAQLVMIGIRLGRTVATEITGFGTASPEDDRDAALAQVFAGGVSLKTDRGGGGAMSRRALPRIFALVGGYAATADALAAILRDVEHVRAGRSTPGIHPEESQFPEYGSSCS